MVRAAGHSTEASGRRDLVEPEELEGVVPQELRPHLVLEIEAGVEFAEDTLEREPRVVAGEHHLVRTTGVGEVDRLFGVVLRREGAGAVVQVRPLQPNL